MKVVERGMPGFIALSALCQQLDSESVAERRRFVDFIPGIHRVGVELFRCSRNCGRLSNNGGESFS